MLCLRLSNVSQGKEKSCCRLPGMTAERVLSAHQGRLFLDPPLQVRAYAFQLGDMFVENVVVKHVWRNVKMTLERGVFAAQVKAVESVEVGEAVIGGDEEVFSRHIALFEAMAARYANVLNAEPGWRRICDVRSNGERRKSVPPTSARNANP